MVEAFEGNKAETATMLPVIKAFKDAHRLHDVIVVADAGMVSEANKKAIEAEGLWFILGARIPDVPYVVQAWRDEHPEEQVPDGHIFTQPWPAGPTDGRRDHVFYYQYRHDRARRTLKGIDEQVAKAEHAVAGKAPLKRNRFIRLDGATKSVNRDLEAKARALAGVKGYVTNLPAAAYDPSWANFGARSSFRSLTSWFVVDDAETCALAGALVWGHVPARAHREDLFGRHSGPDRVLQPARFADDGASGVGPHRGRGGVVEGRGAAEAGGRAGRARS